MRQASFALFFCLVCTLVFADCSRAAITFLSDYRYEQTGNTDFRNNVGAFPTNLVRTETTPISEYKFNIQSVPSTFTELKARAGVDISIDQRNSNTTWQKVTAAGRAKSSLVDVGFVQGQQGVPGGWLQFNWVVTGTSDITLDARGPNALGVDTLQTRAFLKSSQPGAGSVPEVEVHDLGSRFLGNTVLADVKPTASDVQQFFIPWAQGQTSIPVFFDLEVSFDLEINNFDAAGFKAMIDADFSNTADLVEVLVLDENRDVISGATFVGEDGSVYPNSTSGPTPGTGNPGTPNTPPPGTGNPTNPQVVPEPATLVIWGIFAAIAGIVSRKRRSK